MSYSIQKYPVLEPLERIHRHDYRGDFQSKLGELLDTSRAKRLHTFVKQGDHLSILVSFRYKIDNEYACKQYDFPLKVLSWFPSALEEFRKPPAEGGLHAGAMISKDVDVDGEMLAVGSSTDGYYIINRSRNVHDDGDIYDPMEISLSWEFLYTLGFLDLWEALGQKYERGELDYLMGDL